LWSAFVLVHVVIVVLALYGPGNPLGDVAVVYRGWADGLRNGTIAGVTTPFVYPVLAMLPISAAFVLGDALYVYAWFLLVTVFDAAAFFVLVRGLRPHRVRAAWWWLAFQLLLGPIALSRIDSVTVSVAIIGLLWLGSRPFWGTALLVLATWVKIWPAAAIAALFVVWPKRWRMLLLAAAISLGIVVVALALGSGMNVFSFVTAQTSRGIQIESPVGGIWMWLTALQVPGSSLYYGHPHVSGGRARRGHRECAHDPADGRYGRCRGVVRGTGDAGRRGVRHRVPVARSRAHGDTHCVQ